MIVRLLFIISGLMACKYAQSSDSIPYKTDTVTDSVTKRNTTKAKPVSPRLVKDEGYRLQVIKTRYRKKAFLTKGELMQDLPHVDVYVVYKSPYFRVRLGNFVTKKEADLFKRKYLSHLSGVYTVKDTVVYMWYPPD